MRVFELVFNHYHDQRVSLFNALPLNKNSIVFLGDSLTDGCEWPELLKNYNIVNRGINGDTTEGILLRLRSVTKDRPSKIFIMAGCNDFGWGKSVLDTFNNYKLIIDRIQGESPETKIFIQGNIPVFGATVNKKLSSLNRKLQELCNNKNIIFIDLFKHFLNKQGKLNPEYTNDGTHLTSKGYLLWKQFIIPHL